MKNNNQTKNRILKIAQRLIPGTIDIGHCDSIEYCMGHQHRSCNDIKNLCISCHDGEKIIGGLSFPLNREIGNGIVIYRYGQAGSYATIVEGKGINEIMEKVEKNEIINEIAEETKFLNEERKEAENLKTIDAFKRYVDKAGKDDICLLVIKKNKEGEYDNLDKELLKIAKEKEEKGKKIKIIDESEIEKKIYLLGIGSKKLFKKLAIEADAINDADNRMHIFIIPVSSKDGYVGILVINSIEDDVLETDEKKDSWKKYFTEKYKGLDFIGKETINKK